MASGDQHRADAVAVRGPDGFGDGRRRRHRHRDDRSWSPAGHDLHDVSPGFARVSVVSSPPTSCANRQSSTGRTGVQPARCAARRAGPNLGTGGRGLCGWTDQRGWHNTGFCRRPVPASPDPVASRARSHRVQIGPRRHAPGSTPRRRTESLPVRVAAVHPEDNPLHPVCDAINRRSSPNGCGELALLAEADPAIVQTTLLILPNAGRHGLQRLPRCRRCAGRGSRARRRAAGGLVPSGYQFADRADDVAHWTTTRRIRCCT